MCEKIIRDTNSISWLYTMHISIISTHAQLRLLCRQQNNELLILHRAYREQSMDGLFGVCMYVCICVRWVSQSILSIRFACMIVQMQCMHTYMSISAWTRQCEKLINACNSFYSSAEFWHKYHPQHSDSVLEFITTEPHAHDISADMTEWL